MNRYFSMYPLASTCFHASTLGRASAHVVHESFRYPLPPRRLFDDWMGLSPRRIWGGPSSFFELLLVPKGADYIVYDRTSRHFPRLKPGMLLFLRLEVGDSLEIPVAFQITRVDQQNLVVELSYLTQNATHGAQTLTFKADGRGTKIMQVSRFSSRKALRDVIYPYYHRMLLDDFYQHMKEILK